MLRSNGRGTPSSVAIFSIWKKFISRQTLVTFVIWFPTTFERYTGKPIDVDDPPDTSIPDPNLFLFFRLCSLTGLYPGYSITLSMFALSSALYNCVDAKDSNRQLRLPLLTRELTESFELGIQGTQTELLFNLCNYSTPIVRAFHTHLPPFLSYIRFKAGMRPPMAISFPPLTV